jgi:hypothetical protein
MDPPPDSTGRIAPKPSVADMPWGMREYTLTDPSGNHVRVGHGTG